MKKPIFKMSYISNPADADALLFKKELSYFSEVLLFSLRSQTFPFFVLGFSNFVIPVFLSSHTKDFSECRQHSVSTLTFRVFHACVTKAA